jgi:hypothetical protein
MFYVNNQPINTMSEDLFGPFRYEDIEIEGGEEKKYECRLIRITGYQYDGRIAIQYHEEIDNLIKIINYAEATGKLYLLEMPAPDQPMTEHLFVIRVARLMRAAAINQNNTYNTSPTRMVIR